MPWVQEVQYRYRYTSDGRSEMSWQPSPVYKPDQPKSKSDTPDKTFETLAFYICVFTTVLAYGLVGHTVFMRNLDGWPRITLLAMTIVTAFVGTAALLQSKIIQTLIKLSISCFVVILIWHLSK